MARYTFPAFDKASTPRYVVLWDLQWHVIECQRLEPAADLSGAMAAAIERLEVDGWQGRGNAAIRLRIRPARPRSSAAYADRAGSGG
jgi:hypothetical protein